MKNVFLLPSFIFSHKKPQQLMFYCLQKKAVSSTYDPTNKPSISLSTCFLIPLIELITSFAGIYRWNPQKATHSTRPALRNGNSALLLISPAPYGTSTERRHSLNAINLTFTLKNFFFFAFTRVPNNKHNISKRTKQKSRVAVKLRKFN